MRRIFPFLICVMVFAVGYMIIQFAPLRALYSPWDKFAHAAAFFAAWWMLLWAIRWKAIWISLLAALLGGAIEIHQMFLLGFFPSWSDWFADLAGIALACSLWGGLRRWRDTQAKVTAA